MPAFRYTQKTPHALSLICLLDMRWWPLGRSNSGSDGVERSTRRSGSSSDPTDAAMQCRQQQTNIPVTTTTSSAQSTRSSHTKTDPNPKVMAVPYEELLSHLQRTTQELETVRREFADERRTIQKALSEVQAALAQSQSEVANLRQQLQQEVAVRVDDRRLLDARARELHDAQAYLTTVDTVSVAETLSMVGNLNSDIFQTAATISDETFSEYCELSNKINERAERWFGPDIAHLLYKSRARNAESRTLVIQTVVQFALAQACLHITQFWDAALESTSLGSAYNRITTTSSQSVSARWRVLTRGNVKYIDPAVVDTAALERITYVLSIVLASLAGREELQPIGTPIATRLSRSSDLPSSEL
ncbi:hypothetical protein BDZ89DRAFT_1161726 [Hymenopellis radicata]|nr:hypothetical protein BDZ89DRAFT_1161726 [Hymenopellis radicata]